MFCIAAFIIFAILGIFSATFRPLAAKAWHCTWRKMTLRPCDISFGEEMKGRLLAKVVFRSPRLARFLERWIDWFAFAFVVLSIWSLVYTANAGLNYWVYGTCNPQNVESCSLGGESCGIDQATLRLPQALKEGRLGEWAIGPFTRFFQTVLLIPDRLRTWNAEEYLAPMATFLKPRDPAKPTVLEIVDPGCVFCRTLTNRVVESRLADRANVSYLLYPIIKPDGKPKFPHSPLIASVVEATKDVPLGSSSSSAPPDWQLLEKIFTPPSGNEDLQTQFNLVFTRPQAEAKLRELLAEIGYTPDKIDRIMTLAATPSMESRLAEQRTIAEDRIRTIKIPTLLMNSRRYDRLVDLKTLQESPR